MALNLKLLPSFWGDPWSVMDPNLLCTTTIRLQSDYDLFSHIQDIHKEKDIDPVCQPKPVPPTLRVFKRGEDGFKRITEDKYGEPLAYVYVKELLKIPKKILDDTSPWNRGVWTFLEHLNPEAEIILYWS